LPASLPGHTLKADNLIWIDLEMTGLDTQVDRIIEIATIVTDSFLLCGGRRVSGSTGRRRAQCDG
jgi:hypothetical protein